jgi:hypothetical protein
MEQHIALEILQFWRHLKSYIPIFHFLGRIYLKKDVTQQLQKYAQTIRLTKTTEFPLSTLKNNPPCNITIMN